MNRLSPLVLLLLLSACAPQKVGPPPVDIDRLAALTLDLHLAEAVVTEIPVIVRDSMRDIYLEKTLAEHNYTQIEFDSLTWIIRSEPVWIDSLYQRVGDLLDEKKATIKAVEK